MACRMRERGQQGAAPAGAPQRSTADATPAPAGGGRTQGRGAANGAQQPSTPVPVGEFPIRSRTRPGLVFIAANGTYEPRIVRLGVGNLDFTEVVSGVEEGERVALLAAVAAQARRDEAAQRIRGMTGGGVPGMQRTPAGGTPGAGGPPRGGSR
jgi:HlyD family secretion protein